jgi:hypothetical protein
MTEGDGEGVGGVGRLGRRVQVKETSQHLLDLGLARRPVTGDRRLHRGGDVFENRHPSLGRDEEGYA